eukprot:1151838-Pelagomonas_calceolata.AAC.1
MQGGGGEWEKDICLEYLIGIQRGRVGRGHMLGILDWNTEGASGERAFSYVTKRQCQESDAVIAMPCHKIRGIRGKAMQRQCQERDAMRWKG